MRIRALLVAVLVMGVLLVAGTGTLGVLIVRRAAGPLAQLPASLDAVLDEPAGTRIAGIAAVQDRLALHLQGGGPDRVVLVDPRTGGRAGAIRLAR